MKKYLVTGGTGFIGSALVRRLVGEGASVRVLDNNLRGSIGRLADVADCIEFVEADIRDPAAVREACRGVDAVVHLAFINGTEYFYTMPELVLEVGVKGMMNVLDGCIANGVGELALASSSEVYQTPPMIPTGEDAPLAIPDPLNPRYSYAGGKIISELLALNYGRKRFGRVLVFRPHNVYGPDMGWEHVIPEFALRMKAQAAKTGGGLMRFRIQGDGRQTRAFCHIRDFTDGLMRVLGKGRHMGIYHIGTDEERTIRELAQEVGRYYGKKVAVVPGKAARGGTLRRCPDITKLRRLGYKPRVPFNVGVAETVRWYDENSEKRRRV